MKQYDIFISYRRSSYPTANLIATRLKAAGYSVFFDIETLRSGKFNEQLYHVIENCKDFLLVLPPNALDRCSDAEDWVRLEVCHAMANNKNIIPVMLNGFEWPKPMPDGMEELCNYQALAANSVEYFDLSMRRLTERYLISKRHIPVFKFIKYATAVVVALLVFLAILWGVFMVLSRDVCKKYATSLAVDASYVHIIAEENNKLKKDWENFDSKLKYEKKQENIEALQESMIDRIECAEQNLKQCWLADSVKMNISPWHGFLLSLHGINAEEMALSPQLATFHYKDYINSNLGALRRAAETPNTLNMRYATTLFEVFEHTNNMYYASVLAELSAFPEYSREVFRQLYPNWIYFPIQNYKIDEDVSYYENIIRTESRLGEQVVARYESMLEVMDAELEDLQKKSDNLEELMHDGFDNLQLQVEKQIDKQYTEMHELLKKNFRLNPEDELWSKWGKIRRWGYFLSIVIKEHKEIAKEGLRNTLSVTPKIVYTDLCSQLDVYEQAHPESKEYVTAARLFYGSVAKSELDYGGILIFGFKDDAKHKVFEKGDIIIKYSGRDIRTYEDLKAAYKENETGNVTFLRVVNGKLQRFEDKLENTDIIGFLELTEYL